MKWIKGVERSVSVGPRQMSVVGDKGGLWQEGGLSQVLTARDRLHRISVQVSPAPK